MDLNATWSFDLFPVPSPTPGPTTSVVVSAPVTIIGTADVITSWAVVAIALAVLITAWIKR